MVQKMFARASTLVHDMGNQPQVPFDEDISRLYVPLGRQSKILPFLLLGKGLGETAGVQLKGIQQRAEHQIGGCQHFHHLSHTVFPGVCPLAWSSYGKIPGFSEAFMVL